MFAEDEFYPGSRRRRRESKAQRQARLTAEREVARAEEGWDAHPKKWAHPVTGVTLELFRIGALAKALRRDPVTIRAWIRKGWLPQAPYRTRKVEGTRGDAGRRLWSRTQIEGITKIAQEEGLLNDNPPRLQHTKFTQRVTAAWKEWL